MTMNPHKHYPVPLIHRDHLHRNPACSSCSYLLMGHLLRHIYSWSCFAVMQLLDVCVLLAVDKK